MMIKNSEGIRNINDLTGSIGRSIIASFLIFGSLSAVVLCVLQIKMRTWDSEQIENAIYLYSLIMLSVLISFTVLNRYRVKSIVNHYIADPIEKITQVILNDQICSPDQIYIDELNYLIEHINHWKLEVKKAKGEKHEAAIGRLASQVAHDIRSPLAALDTVIKYTTELAEEKRNLIRNTVLRIHDIANNLLGQYKEKNQGYILPSVKQPELIAEIFLKIISEKRVQLEDSSIQFVVDVHDDVYDAFAEINATEFQRALSNLLQNAIEAITHQGCILLSMKREAHLLSINIDDNGCGIPPEILPRILEGKHSVGKQGSGLGLARAKDIIESWGGKFEIKSNKNGTSINIQLHESCKLRSYQGSILR